jgi:hypothetical protein
MRDPATEWRFSVSVDEARRRKLCRAKSFEQLVDDVLADVRVIRAIVERGRDPGLTDCLQPVFFLELAVTGDALFNGPHGYRAQYWTDPWRGLEANALLLSSLRPKLLASVDTNDQPQLAELDVSASLSAVSAKFWIREAPSTMTKTRELQVEPWLSAAENGIEKAVLGLAAPQTSKYEVKGALLDKHGNERVPARKIGRHHEIHRFGFS